MRNYFPICLNVISWLIASFCSLLSRRKVWLRCYKKFRTKVCWAKCMKKNHSPTKGYKKWATNPLWIFGLFWGKWYYIAGSELGQYAANTSALRSSDSLSNTHYEQLGLKIPLRTPNISRREFPSCERKNTSRFIFSRAHLRAHMRAHLRAHLRARLKIQGRHTRARLSQFVMMFIA